MLERDDFYPPRVFRRARVGPQGPGAIPGSSSAPRRARRGREPSDRNFKYRGG